MKIFLIFALFSPLLTSIISGFYGYRIKRIFVGWISTISIFFSFIFFLILYLNPSEFEMILYNWMNSPFNINFSLIKDKLSNLMGLVVSIVSFVVHLYSIYYMKEDEGYVRFFSYLNLFVFFMLLLTFSGNLMVMFIGWEGVGLCSYLLISYWYKKESASKAGVKAFVVNKIGDVFFIVGIISILFLFKNLNFYEIKNLINYAPLEILKFSGICLFIGAIGKSAQFPLYIWLPDAMEGPTPVSALIHAATMVTAGVYMILRLSFLYIFIPEISLFIAIIGSFTTFYSALCAIKEDDLKKILAYSTISQLGYMFAGAGIYIFGKSFFHLLTHAFFKALLFLIAGIIIHSLNGEMNIKKMGNLKKLKYSNILFLIGALSLSGIPPLGSYFSKEGIIEGAIKEPLIYLILTLSSFLTSLYIFRAYFIIFYGEEKTKIHKEDKKLLFPSFILGIFSIFSGLLDYKGNIEKIFFDENSHINFLSFIPLIFSIIGILTAWKFYYKKEIEEKGFIFELVENKFYFDKILSIYFVKFLYKISEIFEKIVENGIIEGTVNGIGKLNIYLSKILLSFQKGSARFYLKVFFTFLFFLLIFYLLKFV
jgi:NADH-quinone oxidoreductase subunit L